jgi:hypothetical protein
MLKEDSGRIEQGVGVRLRGLQSTANAQTIELSNYRTISIPVERILFANDNQFDAGVLSPVQRCGKTGSQVPIRPMSFISQVLGII